MPSILPDGRTPLLPTYMCTYMCAGMSPNGTAECPAPWQSTMVSMISPFVDRWHGTLDDIRFAADILPPQEDDDDTASDAISIISGGDLDEGEPEEPLGCSEDNPGGCGADGNVTLIGSGQSRRLQQQWCQSKSYSVPFGTVSCAGSIQRCNSVGWHRVD